MFWGRLHLSVMFVFLNSPEHKGVKTGERQVVQVSEHIDPNPSKSQFPHGTGLECAVYCFVLLLLLL